ncbi:Mg2+ transporter [Pyrenophora seminiperda CCB06]|uniref:Mg2+ transporter n=1 Tax=Pyrenophora seminiperda CCB06 TaxID=1302712 RepID=A0A3M7M9G6_9PLEO|nr:Mg2+ transporter [Pyrenophora seminiperda CCB06]
MYKVYLLRGEGRRMRWEGARSSSRKDRMWVKLRSVRLRVCDLARTELSIMRGPTNPTHGTIAEINYPAMHAQYDHLSGNHLSGAWGSVLKPYSYIRIKFDDDNKGEDMHLRDIRYPSPPLGRYPSPPPPAGLSDEDSTKSKSENDVTEPPPDAVAIPDVVRKAVAPVDSENNKLSFQVDTTRKQKTSSEELDASKGVGLDRIETTRITRAMYTQDQGRNMITLYKICAPVNDPLRRAVTMTWYHTSDASLDFDRFTNMCLNTPSLSPRLRTLAHKLLAKVWKDKVKRFQGGMFIEPGTVLRADEQADERADKIDQPDPQSAIFSCVPYFSLERPVKGLSSGPGSKLFPPRTLMQAFYPFEPIGDRDEEQSYKTFSELPVHKILHVPSLWIMNIGPDFIVTYGHTSISEATVKSIIVKPEDTDQLNSHDVANNTLRKIRLTDWDGQEFIFSIGSCRSYFELESKVLDLRYRSRRRAEDEKIRLQHKTQDGSKEITPSDWVDLITRNDLVFITLAVIENKEGEEKPSPAMSSPQQAAESSSAILLPFFHWPQPTPRSSASDEKKVQPLTNPDVQQTYSILEQADRMMMKGLRVAADNKVATTFESAIYYRSLPELTFQDVSADFANLQVGSKRAQQIGSGLTFHQKTIDSQRVRIIEQTRGLFEIVQMMFKLFVSDLNQSKILRKGWGAMKQLHDKAHNMTMRGSVEPDPKEYTDPEWKHHDMMERTWYIRTSAQPSHLAVPETHTQLNNTIMRCKRCSKFESYNSPEAALKHLRKHAKKAASSENNGAIDTAIVSTSLDEQQSLPPDSVLKAWVLNSEQFRREEINGETAATLTKACKTARELFVEARELGEGVKNEDGRISNSYKMPHELVWAFRDIMVFFMSIERAVHYSAERLRDEKFFPKMSQRYTGYDLDTEPDEAIVKEFGGTAQQSLRKSRFKLCAMVRPNPPLDLFKQMSLGPEYVCAWLMRRLVVKPLEIVNERDTRGRGSLSMSERPQQQRDETVGELYREYLFNLQFQVNSRASKRLLRRINLVQEELDVLIAVNTWQANLIQNYTHVLDDISYEQDMPARRSMFPHERDLLETCLYHLQLARDDYNDLISHCRPLSNRTKQILEISEEDHGKAIMIFTVVTVIFLPLSFATSYFGMNTADIRDMNQTQSLFWSVAIPLTILTVGGCMLIGYNGDEMVDAILSFARKVTGQKKRDPDAGGIAVSNRKPPPNPLFEMTGAQESSHLNEVEFADPRPGERELIEDDWLWPEDKDNYVSYQKEYEFSKSRERDRYERFNYEDRYERNYMDDYEQYDRTLSRPARRVTRMAPTSRVDRMGPKAYHDRESEDEWYGKDDTIKRQKYSRRRPTEGTRYERYDRYGYR